MIEHVDDSIRGSSNDVVLDLVLLSDVALATQLFYRR